MTEKERSRMQETFITCPNCGAEIPVSQVLQEQIRHELEARLRAEQEQRLDQAVAKAEQRARERIDMELRDLRAQLEENKRTVEAARERELALRKQARELEEQREGFEAQVEGRVQERLESAVAEKLEARLNEERVRVEQEKALLQEQLREQQKKAEAAQKAELGLRKEKAALEQRAREMDLEIQRRLDEEKQKLEASLRDHLREEQELKLKEKEKQIEDLRQALEDAKRRSELGSQELQGEVLELDIQAALERQFPQDRIEPVPKGIRGADIIQTVRNERLEECGAIIWETKNAKNWQAVWLDKLKQDQRAVGGSLAVIVSSVVPEGIKGFGRIDGVWVSDLKNWPSLAGALREQLVQVHFARAASEGQHEKMELLYRYLAGDEFRQRVETIVEAFEAMQAQIQKERRAMERHWTEREKQLQRVIGSTTGMYGALQGIVGSGMQTIPALEFDEETEHPG